MHIILIISVLYLALFLPLLLSFAIEAKQIVLKVTSTSNFNILPPWNRENERERKIYFRHAIWEIGDAFFAVTI